MFGIFIVLLVTAIYLYLRYVYSYWSRNGFPYLEPSIPAGNLQDVAKRQKSYSNNIYELYKQSTEPFVGIYMFFKPALLIRDASLARRILVADFASFHDRGIYLNPKHDPYSETIFAMTGNRWKSLRSKMTTIFTTGKLKSMIPAVMAEGDRLVEYLENSADSNEVLDTFDVMSRYALNIIGSVIFGLEVDTINNPKDTFRLIEKRIFGPGFWNELKTASIILCPALLEFFKVNLMSPDVQEYMTEIVKSQIEFREKHEVSRQDFIQILIQLRNNCDINENNDSWDVKTLSEDLKSLTIEQCAAQVFFLYIAGFDTSALTLTYTLYELARNPEIQRKFNEDVQTTLSKHNGQLTYESILDMKYVDICMSETMRKYPVLPVFNRVCTIDYPIPGTKHIIKKGTSVAVSTLGISRDAAYFPDPDIYRPERFSGDENAFNSDAYMPFGIGPRACTGLRLGKMMVKIGLIKLMQKYKFESVNNKPIELNNYSVLLIPKNSIDLRVSHRNAKNMSDH